MARVWHELKRLVIWSGYDRVPCKVFQWQGYGTCWRDLSFGRGIIGFHVSVPSDPTPSIMSSSSPQLLSHLIVLASLRPVELLYAVTITPNYTSVFSCWQVYFSDILYEIWHWFSLIIKIIIKFKNPGPRLF